MGQPQQPAVTSQTVSVELPAELEAVYANFAIINHSPSEVIIDFARMLPNMPRTKVHARVVMTPMNAKLLYEALGENLGKFEGKYGEIKTYRQGFSDERPMGFRQPEGE